MKQVKEMGIVEKVFAEPEHFTAETMSNIADELEKNIAENSGMNPFLSPIS